MSATEQNGAVVETGRLQPRARIVCWFSAGAASAVAAKLTLVEHGHENVVIAYTDPGSEHPDNRRFIDDCIRWFDHEVIILKSDRYANVDEVIEKRRFLNGPQGALCTVELKKKLRQAFQLFTDKQVFGYTADKADAARADRFRVNNVEVDLVTPLIERGLTKSDCLAMIDAAGIELPAMYKLGYQNNNCIGCVKGGIGYWNKIRRDFPEVFWRRARQERDIGASMLKESYVDGYHESWQVDDEGVEVFVKTPIRKSRKLFLDELDPNRGNHADEPSFECSLLCTTALEEVA